MDLGAGGKPTGPYAERMLVGAWCESDPADLYATRDEWHRLRDEARDTYADLKNNAAQLRQVLDGDGFDELHRDRDLVARNYELLAETRDDAAKIVGGAGDQAENLRRYARSTVHTAHEIIAAIEADPVRPDAEKKSETDALVEDVNEQLKALSAAEAAVLTSHLTAHSAYMAALPWHMSTANASPFTPATHPAGNGVQALNTGWKQSPGGPSGNGTDRGTGGEQHSPPPHEAKPPSKGTEGTERADPQNPSPPQRGTGGGEKPAPPSREVTSPIKGTDGVTHADPPTSSPLAMPGTVSSPAGGPGGGSGLGLGGLRGGFPQGLPPTQLSNLPPLAGVPPAAPAALSSPGAVSAPGGSSALAGPRASVPVQPVSVVPPPAAPVQPPVSPAAGAPAVTPAGVSSPPPAALPATSSAPAVPLAPAPPLAGPPPVPPAAVSPVGPAPVPPVAPSTPFHGPPLPVAGAPQVNREGVVERAEDPDIVRARQLVWECLWHGRRYPMLDWAVGLHRGASGTAFYLTSSEGFPFIPQHVHLPDSPVLTTPFDDREFVPYHRAVMLAGWRNPTRIVLGHHALRAGSGLSTLWAIVSSAPLEADHLRPEGVRIEVVDPSKNPLADPTKATEVPQLAAGRLHRLAVAAPDLWAMVGGVEWRWSAAVGLVGLADEATRERQTFTGLVVGGASVATSDPNGPLLADVARRLERRDQIDTDRLAALRVAYMAAVMDAQRRRHTPQDFTEDTGYVDAYRRARAYEAAVLSAEAAIDDAELSADLLADVAYCTLTAHLPGAGDVVVRDVLRYYRGSNSNSA